jgi:hypothetical protein
MRWKMKYRVVGSRTVAGFAPGSTLGVDDLAGCNVQMLLDAGHLAAVSTKAVKATSAEADEAEQSQED